MNGIALGHMMSQSLARNEHFAPPVKRVPASLSSNLNRLLSAAVVSPRFRNHLLIDPVGALAGGYQGESFNLTPAEYAAVTSLRVTTMQEFAAQLLHIFHPCTETEVGYHSEVKAHNRDRLTEMASPHSRWQESSETCRQATPMRRINYAAAAQNLVVDSQRATQSATRHGV